jgi:hypothetical protein
MDAHRHIRDVVDSSGNTVHVRVARWFECHGWYVVVSPYYMDNSQARAREIDLVVERPWPILDTFGRPTGDLVIRLYIECKYLVSYSAFWFAKKNVDLAEELVCSTGVFRRKNAYTKNHHYLIHNYAAKLFATKGGGDNDPFYRALNQVLNAMVSLRAHPLRHPSVLKRGSCRAILEYPIVVCSSFNKVFKIDFYGYAENKPVEGNFQLEVQYVYTEKTGEPCNQYFLIDIVSEDKLDDFHAAITADAEAAAHLLHDQCDR